MASSSFNVLSLCSGVGMLDLGIRLAIPIARTICFVEREIAAAAILAARMEDALLDEAPIWSDLTTFDGAGWRGKVDCLTAGFPCQPWSCAGERKGLEDERWIWDDIAQIIDEVRPPTVLLENVPGLVRGGGLGFVLRRLAKSGFNAEWDLFRASDLGAPHKRERLFILAIRNDLPHSEGSAIRQLAEWIEQGSTLWRNAELGHLGEGMADTESVEGRVLLRPRESGEEDSDSGGSISELADSKDFRHERPWTSQNRRQGPEDGSGFLGHSERARPLPRSHQRIHPIEEGSGARNVEPDGSGGCLGDANGKRRKQAIRTKPSQCRPFPPGPSDIEAWQRVEAEAQPAIRGVANGALSRVDRLRACGNGVLPVVAGFAFKTLALRMIEHLNEHPSQ